MLKRPLPLDPSQILVNTRDLANRWRVDPVTVRRLCRIHDVTEIRFPKPGDDGEPRGRIHYPREEVEALEARIFHWN